jgi:hypothetical protein
MPRNRKAPSPPLLKKPAKTPDDNNSDIDDQTNDTNKKKSQVKSFLNDIIIFSSTKT